MHQVFRSLAGASIALWLGAVLMTGAAAAIAFPEMRDLGPVLTEYDGHEADHWSIAAGHMMLPVFGLLDIASLALSSLAVLFTGLCIRETGGRAAVALWLIGLIGAGALGIHHAIDRSPEMRALAHDYWHAAKAGDDAVAAQHKAAFDALHPVASGVLRAESGFLLLGLAGWAFSSVRTPLRENDT